MAVNDHILYEIVQNPKICVGVKTNPEGLFRNRNIVIDPLFFQNRDPVDQDAPRQLRGFDRVHGQSEFIGIQPEPVEQRVDIFLQLTGLPAGGPNICILFSACDKPPVSGVKIPDQCGQRSPYIMGKTGHELSVGFIRPAERGQLFLVGGDDLIDFIGDRRGKLVRRGQNAPVAIPRSDILKRVKHFLQPRFYTPDYQNADQNGSGGSYD